MKKTLVLLGLVLCLAAGARAAVLNDIEYGTASGESLRLDAFVPEGAGPFPAVILVHGGGWTRGDKSGGPSKAFIAPMHEPLAKAGFAWFSINYRLAPKHTYPACIEDVETAIRWLKAHAAEYRVDPKRIAIAGESAGAHLVALAAVRGSDATRVAAVVPFYGPFDLIGPLRQGQPMRGPMAALTGRTTFDEQASSIMREASPMFSVKPGLPPFLLVHGDADNTVSYDQSVQFQARLRAVGVPADLITVKGAAHGMAGWDKIAPGYKGQIVDWLKRTLSAPKTAR